jgi:hypothetical protein
MSQCQKMQTSTQWQSPLNSMDMSTIDVLEDYPNTQEDKDNENNKDKEPGDNHSVVLSQWLLTQSLGSEIWMMQGWM